MKAYYTTFYLKCSITVFSPDETHTFDCDTIFNVTLDLGRILVTSHMFEANQRRVAIIFSVHPNTIMVYNIMSTGMSFFGRKDYDGVDGDIVTGIAIAKGKLFAVLELQKKVDIYNLYDLQEEDDTPKKVKPRMVLNKDYLHFFGIDYFAPVDIKVSRFHDEAIFLQTKTGVIVMNVDEDAIATLLFTIPTLNIRYDFEINHNHLLVMTE